MIGIDLGTTNSCVAVMEGGVPQVIKSREDGRTTPSVVAFTPEGQVLVGKAAMQHANSNPKNTVSAVRRLIGRKFDSPEVQQAQRFLPYRLVGAPNGDVHIQIEDKVYSPAEITSFVVHRLKTTAEDYLGEAVEEAIITVPAYFNDRQREATKDAGLIAGLEVSRIVNEPTAAALAYGPKNLGKSVRFVAVYDLGGRTFDITILEMADGLFQVRATGGDTYLGGEDFDQRIIDWLIEEFQRETGIDLTQGRMALQRLKKAAEKAKCELSTAQQTEIVLPFISAAASGPVHISTVLPRQKYEELTDALLERTIELCRRCLADAGITSEQIDAVLLVGGQSRAPKVAEAVRKAFGKEPNRAVDPDEAIAIGAAIKASTSAGMTQDVSMLDVTPHTVGIETKAGTFTPIIERHTTLPTRRSRVFTTVTDNQTRVEVHVLEGESDMAPYNKSLAKFELTDIPPAPRGVPQIEVTFEVDVNGILSVRAQDQTTGCTLGVVIHPSDRLSQARVIRVVSPTRYSPAPGEHSQAPGGPGPASRCASDAGAVIGRRAMLRWRQALTRICSVLGLGWPDPAMRRWRKAAEQGHGDAQNMLGLASAKGEGVPKDEAEAVRRWRKAAELGHADAQTMLGLAYAKGEGVPRDPSEAVRWYRLAAEQGNAYAQHNLGLAYHKGEGVPKDPAESVLWWRMAAEQGLAPAQYNLGVAYHEGEGVPKDPAEAVRWSRKAAEQGHADGQFNLGVAYATGEGVTQNGEAAADWYYRAGLSYATEGRRDRALSCVERIWELQTVSNGRLADKLVAAISGSPSQQTKPN
jgi:molecular chaperone DnaK